MEYEVSMVLENNAATNGMHVVSKAWLVGACTRQIAQTNDASV
jgi:hypothetical protein